MRQADTAAHRGRGVGVTARYHNFILPLPAQPLTVTLAETDAQTHCAQVSVHGRTHNRATRVQHTAETHRTELKVVPVHCFSL